PPQPSPTHDTFGTDAAKLDYRYTSVGQGPNSLYERVDLGRGVLAYALEPAPEKLIDAYPRADGALFELAADYGGVGSVYVYALLPPSAAASAPSSSPVPATAPVAFGRPVPDRLTATMVGTRASGRARLAWSDRTNRRSAGRPASTHRRRDRRAPSLALQGL